MLFSFGRSGCQPGLRKPCPSEEDLLMSRSCWPLVGLIILVSPGFLRAADQPAVQELLGREIIGPRLGLIEVQDYTEAHVPRMPAVKTVAEWEQHANRMRADVLERVVFRGEAAAWRDARLRVEW